jgi:hypothetical protein
MDRGTVNNRFRATFVTLAFVLGLPACAGASSSPSPSVGASSSPEVTASTSPSVAASERANPSGPPTSSSNLFSLLPVPQPSDFVSEISCAGSIGVSDPVALVMLPAAVEGEEGEVVLRDYADPSNPKTVCSFGSGTYRGGVVQLIDARHVVIGSSGAFAVVDLPELRYHWFAVPYSEDPGAYSMEFLAVGPKLDQVVWMRRSGLPGEDTIYVTTSAGDQVIATLPTPGSGRCGSPETDSKTAVYSRSGSHLFVLDQPIFNFHSLVVIAGGTNVLSVVPPSTGWPADDAPLMPLWSPTTDTLYYRQGGNIWKWTDGSDPQLFLSDTNWVHPTISADGAHLAYSVLRPEGLVHDVYLVDLANGGSPQRIGDGARKLPAFINSTQLWYRSQGDDHGCVGSENERPLIYDIVDHVEFDSIIDWVVEVWPATSSNF